MVKAILCLFLAACSTQHDCYRENCFVTETRVTEDMRKIHRILVENYRIASRMDAEYKLKLTEVICKLFSKDNKQLNKEIDKLKKIYESAERQRNQKKLDANLKTALKGLHLDLKEVVLIAKEIEADYAKIISENEKQFAQYKDRAIEIVKILDEQDRKKDSWTSGHYENDLNWDARFEIKYSMLSIIRNSYDKFSIYSEVISILQECIKEGILIDSFLDKHKSVIPPKDEPNTYSLYSYVSSLIPRTTKTSEKLFDAVKNAIAKEKIDKQELSELVGSTASYMRKAISDIVLIQHDVTDRIDHDVWMEAYNESKFSSFNYNYSRRIVTDLVDKNPKFEDFEREIDRLSTRLAYQIYYDTNIARFLYREWRATYYPQMDEFFANAVKLADLLHDMVKDEVVPEDASYRERYQHKDNLKNISDIKEIANIGVEKIFSNADCYIDSQEKIKKSLTNGFLKTRESYLKNTARK